MPESTEFAGVRIQNESRDEVFTRISRLVEEGGYHYQISLNVAKLVYAQDDPRLRAAVNAADIVTADGMPIKWISRWKTGKKDIARMGGLDFMDGLAERHPEWRYYFLGARPEIVSRVVEHYRETHSLNIVGHQHGYFETDEWDDILRCIEALEVDVLYIAFGTPAKEYLLYEWKGSRCCRLGIGVGGAFNIIAGAQTRAPRWIQDIGMEWLYRTMQEPRRMWKRYLTTNSSFLWLLLRELFRK